MKYLNVMILFITTTGCYTDLSIILLNKNSSVIQIESAETGRQLSIEPGCSGKLPYYRGNFIVSINGGQYLYKDISLLTMDIEYTRKGKYFLGYASYITMHLEYREDAKIYVLKPKWIGYNENGQPDGYPKSAERLEFRGFGGSRF